MTPPLMLADLRVLLVEDDDLIAALIKEWLIEQRCVIIGPCSHLNAALDAAHTAEIDIALLDVNLGADSVYPVAELLYAQGTPFLFLSGYGEEAAPADHPDWPVCSKPFRMGDLLRGMLDALKAQKE